MKATKIAFNVRQTGSRGEVELTSPRPEDLAQWLAFAGAPADACERLAPWACRSRASSHGLTLPNGVGLSWRNERRRRVYTITWDRPFGTRVER